MIKNITIGQYIPGETLIHKLDARMKIVSVFIYIATLFLSKNIYSYIPAFIILSITILLSKTPIKFLIKGVKPILIFIFITFLLNLFMTKGEVLFSIWILTLTKEGIIQGSAMAIRLILLVLGTNMLTLTTSPMDLTDGIENLLSPLKKIKIPAHEIAMMITIALRFIPTLLEEADKIMKAQMARGADFESKNLFKRAKSLIPILIPLFVNAFRRADELATAMESRCYRGGVGRTKMRELSIKPKDIILLIIMILSLVLGLLIRSKV